MLSHLSRYDPRILAHPAGRRAIAQDNLLTFALIYLREHLVGPDGSFSLAACHREWVALAEQMPVAAGPRAWRHAFAAPRETGKSTWWLLIIPLWLAATGRIRFIAAFADSATQAQEHLATFKREVESNVTLRRDYPGLCTPRRRRGGHGDADRREMYIAENGFVYTAKGADSKVLGIKVGATRPQLIILDDIEGDESSYSADKADKRLRTVQDAILPLNERAPVIMTGTVTMAGSIVHQLVKHASGQGDAQWITDERFIAHHHKPITRDTEGGEVSIWPEKWPLKYLHSMRHTRSYLKNFLNMPMSLDGAYWRPEHFIRGELDSPSMVVLSIDPAVSGGKKSDTTGLAILEWSRATERARVAACTTVRLRGSQLRERVLSLIETHSVTVVLIETNQGGDLWVGEGGLLAHLPVRVITVHQTRPKEVRAEDALRHYEAQRVLHARAGLDDLESNMCAFPKVAHDDDVDAVTTAIIELFKARRPARRAVQSRI